MMMTNYKIIKVVAILGKHIYAFCYGSVSSWDDFLSSDWYDIEVARFDILNNEWKNERNITTKIIPHQVIVFNKKIYILGKNCSFV